MLEPRRHGGHGEKQIQKLLFSVSLRCAIFKNRLNHGGTEDTEKSKYKKRFFLFFSVSSVPPWFKKIMLFGKRAYQLTAEETALEALFTNTEHLRQLFQEFVTAQNLPKRLLIIHGVGGGGKSTLLKMFRLFCKKQAIPVGFVSVDEAKTGVEMLSGLSDEFGKSGVKLPEFIAAFQRYQAIQAKVEEKLRAGQNKLANAGKASAKVALETAATAVLGPLGSVVGGMSADALTDWLFGFLTKPDVDFYLNPLKLLTQQFVADLAKTAAKKRVTLMFDTYEQIGTLDDWVRELARAAHGNILFVIATRSFRGEAWERDWPGCLMQARFEELRPMEDEHLRDVISRYYQAMRGATPDPAQVEAVVKFSRGLPLVATTAARLWAAYDHTDFQTIKAQVAADLVDRLLESVPKTIERLVEAAAALRWFDQSVLRAVLETEIPAADFKELRQFPFTRPMREGKLALHDVVRDVLDENLKIHDPARHKQWHERAAAYFEQAMPQTSLSEQELFGLERLYHRIRANEETGMQLFQATAEELARYRMVNRLKSLLSDANTYPLEQENSRLWREYYHARILNLEGNEKASIAIYEKIIANHQIDTKLKAYSLGDLGYIWIHFNYDQAAADKSIQLLEEGYKFLPKSDFKLTSIFEQLSWIYQNWKHDIAKHLEYTNQLSEWAENQNDEYTIIEAYELLQSNYTSIGYWKEVLKFRVKALQKIENFPNRKSLGVRVKRADRWAFPRMGRYKESEIACIDALEYAQQVDDALYIADISRDLGHNLGLQRKYSLAYKYLADSQNFYENTIVIRQIGIISGYQGRILITQNLLNQAEKAFNKGLQFKRESSDNVGIPQILAWFGELEEIRLNYGKAEYYYRETLNNYRWTGRYHDECRALVGLARVKYAQGKLADVPALIAEAEALAQQYEYNEHIAALHLLQGHLLWQEEPDAAFDFYQQALIYALRYNRFCLDEILFGDNIPTPYQPLIPFCLQRGEDGRNTLRRLKAFWQTGANDVGQPRPDTISPIPENIPLLDAERLAREREPGDGSPQMPVMERLDSVLQE